MEPDYKWIAQDAEGAIWFFNTKPELELAFDAFYAESDSDSKRAGTGKPNPNWRDSLIDLEKEDYEIVDGILERRRKHNPNVLTDTELLDAIVEHKLRIGNLECGGILVWADGAIDAVNKKGDIRKAIKKWLKKNVDKKETKE